jgi:hypothetical protein
MGIAKWRGVAGEEGHGLAEAREAPLAIGKAIAIAMVIAKAEAPLTRVAARCGTARHCNGHSQGRGVAWRGRRGGPRLSLGAGGAVCHRQGHRQGHSQGPSTVGGAARQGHCNGHGQGAWRGKKQGQGVALAAGGAAWHGKGHCQGPSTVGCVARGAARRRRQGELPLPPPLWGAVGPLLPGEELVRLT